ncbi:putative peroxidase [Helianthus annuus]|uniref:peroxidase n=1 Tax=Helianthus annuus TaxID=4232 RepID=A0A9K3DXK0_HELAN|nr:putative peroxidase [Helianthus annuus]KAJ0462272.1 putative peroxidase [Helianthus annuus]KAJ0837960.1 putative peroxidase [Helianthus annuus]
MLFIYIDYYYMAYDDQSRRTLMHFQPFKLQLMLRYHGCDASLLLGGAGSEKESPANDGVLGYDVIDVAKAAVESVCPGVVSCADILAVAARDASVVVGGQSWTVRLGRRDSPDSNAAEAATDLSRGNMNLGELISNFANKGPNTREMVALSG